MRSLLLTMFVVLIVAGCQTTVSRPVEKGLSFSSLPTLVFDVGRIEVVEAYRPSMGESHVDHDFPTPPIVAVKTWVQDRLRVKGTFGVLRLTIRDASVRIESLETNADIEGLVTTEQSERLDATLLVTIEILNDAGEIVANTRTEARRSRTIPEGITLDERDQLYYSVIESLLNDYNATQEQSIRKYFAAYLR